MGRRVRKFGQVAKVACSRHCSGRGRDAVDHRGLVQRDPAGVDHFPDRPLRHCRHDRGPVVDGTPFGFVALLGAMSLAGIMIKNAIVLLDEVNVNLMAGKSQYDAVTYAALSRLRPVFLAAATTVLGVIPLLPDVFWAGLAVTVMAGLTIGTVFTMITVPVLYATFYRIRPA
jgi:AcrB/AcrD/AcrF family